MKRTAYLLAGITAFAGCSKPDAHVTDGVMTKAPKMGRTRVVIDEGTIATNDVQAIIEPVWWTANIYDSYAAYESSLAEFSHPQRLVYAIEWYAGELYNGGHYQFYFNSTGIVWADAKKGFEEIGMPEIAEIIAESAKRMGGQPSSVREERIRALEKDGLDFDDLDNRFYELSKSIDAKLREYILENSADFLFDGEVEKPTTW